MTLAASNKSVCSVSGFAKVKENSPMKNIHVRKIRFAVFIGHWISSVQNENGKSNLSDMYIFHGRILFDFCKT
jgi:hypothetical protein